MSDDFSSPCSLAEAAAIDGAQLFVFPAGGDIEAVLVLTADRLVWELRTDNACAWLEGFLTPGSSPLELEAGLAHWCEWVPRVFRGVVLGLESPDDLASSRH